MSQALSLRPTSVTAVLLRRANAQSWDSKHSLSPKLPAKPQDIFIKHIFDATFHQPHKRFRSHFFNRVRRADTKTSVRSARDARSRVVETNTGCTAARYDHSGAARATD